MTRTQCYQILGIEPGSSRDEIKRAYRDLTKVWHPDRFANDPRLQEIAHGKIREIIEAYERLEASTNEFDDILGDDLTPNRPSPNPEPGPSPKTPPEPPPRTGQRSPFETPANDPWKIRRVHSKKTRWRIWLRRLVFLAAIIGLIAIVRYLVGPFFHPRQLLRQLPGVSQGESREDSRSVESAGSAAEAGELRDLPRSFHTARPRDAMAGEPPWTNGQPGAEQDDSGNPAGAPEVTQAPVLPLAAGQGGRHSRERNPLADAAVAAAAAAGRFTLHSSERDVLAAQGKPTASTKESWHYGSSRVQFHKHSVVGYSDDSRMLKVVVTPRVPVNQAQARGYLLIGSTKDEVAAIQGTPSAVFGNTWHYGDSWISFSQGRVTAWSDAEGTLKIRKN